MKTSRLRIAGFALMAVALALIVFNIMSGGKVDRAAEWAWGNVKVNTQEWVSSWDPNHEQVVRLGGLGGMPELDQCTGEYIEVESYRVVPDLPPVYAAHNNCGGDVMLSWKQGSIVRVDGTDDLYVVGEERHTPKWTELSSLEGMDGEFILQTCFYGEDRMRFIALVPYEGE